MCKKTISSGDFFKLFPDNETARKHLEKQRWDKRPICVFCAQANRVQKRKRVGFYRCGHCKKDFTVRSGTIFAKSNVGLDVWFYAIYLIMTARKGVSSLQLSKKLGVTQKTAWHMVHRIRAACGGNDERLRGIVEINETYAGDKERKKYASKKLKQGRWATGKQAVVGMRERGGKAHTEMVERTDKATLHSMVAKHVEPGSSVCTDEHIGYSGLGGTYKYSTVRHSASEYVNGMAHTSGIESVWTILKGGINGIFHHVSIKHLPQYLSEFTFRLNDGSVNVHVLDRLDSTLSGAEGRVLPYKALTQQ